jgi:hypothetical protein
MESGMSHDKDTLERRIRERAYALWDADGQPDGTPDEYWYRAHREMTQDDRAKPGSLDDQLEDTFPASDPLSVTQPHVADVAWPKEAPAQTAPTQKEPVQKVAVQKKAPAQASTPKAPAEAVAKKPAAKKPTQAGAKPEAAAKAKPRTRK